MKKTAFLLFEQMWQRHNTGSSRIRGHWLMNYMPEADLFKQGRAYDVIIYQKAYWKEMARNFEGINILDICDPDWLDGVEIVTFAESMSAITVPTEALQADLVRMVKCPVYVIKDRIDLATLPKPKKHQGTAKSVVWFGYSHNSWVLEEAIDLLKELNLKLIVISDGRFLSSDITVENIKWDVETVNAEIQKADFVLFPATKKGRHAYKSENKTVQSWALGMPVATSPEEVRRFMEGGERQQEVDEKMKIVLEDYDVKKSVEEMRAVIESIKE